MRAVISYLHKRNRFFEKKKGSRKKFRNINEVKTFSKCRKPALPGIKSCFPAFQAHKEKN